MNYKDTLLMPNTEFEMRGNLPKKEPAYVERWKESHMYEKVIEQNKDNDSFVFHDGPPYANGNMHTGHMLNKIIKDVICRYKNMQGLYTPYIPGWDTHGLPIENAIQKLGVNRKEMSTADFRKKCFEYALKQVDIQKEQCIRVGTFADYDHPYVTLQPEFEANQVDVFASMAMDGLIYKGLKPVYWSPSSESALAEAEVEYHDVKSPTIFVKFAVKDGKGVLDTDTSFVIWTTTPWTIPANLAICLNPDYTYALVKTEKGKLLVLEELIDSLWEKFELEEKEILQRFKGTELEMITCQHPLYDRESLVILGDHVTADAGTGCVHTAPGFGMDDFMVGQKYGLDIYCNVDAHGKMMADCGEWLAGQYVDDANKTVTMRLEELGVLLKLEFITHSYPHDWRTKKPIIFRATDQWFCSIDKIREKLLSEIDGVNWLNEWGHVRIYNMIRDRGDWCISRQRTWGVPIPIIYCEDGTPIMEKEVFDHISKLFRENGSNIWFEKDEKDLLPEGYTNEHSPQGIFKKERDIMDVWFDSGSSHTGVMKERGYNYPVDLYFEGSDQYRGWFNSSLIIGVAAHGCAPYKTVLSHGFVLDGKGNKMSKSLGNTVDPIKLVNQYGADIVRLWATSVAYQSDVRISDDLMKQVAENYRKMRNTMRFVLGNLSDFKSKDVLEVSKLEEVDQYMLVKLNHLVKGYHNALDNYDFSEANQLILNCFTNVLSAFYMDFTKDILYIEKEDSLRRRQVQTVLYHYAKTM
ncbi:MAG: isoleucine--tRNA ligase, partial [Coprobacillus sp.]